MSNKNLNKKSLSYMQEGGEDMESGQQSITQQIQSLLDSGASFQQIAQELINQGYDETTVREILMDSGISSSELDEFFEPEEESEEESEEALENNQEANYEEEYDEAEDVNFGMFGNALPEAQTGFESMFPLTANQYFALQQEKNGYSRNPMANYLPMDLGTRGDVAGAGFFLAEAAGDLFGGKEDPNTGLKKGFYRDIKAKRARAKEARPSYYNYKVTTAPGDENTYAGDPTDLYNAARNKDQLRTEQQYKDDVNRFSQFDFDKDKNQYVGQFSSRKIDPGSSIYSKNQKKDLEKFLQNSTSLGDLESRFDPKTLNMLIGSQKEGMGSLGINPSGEASSYKSAQENPYLYETMMGLNTLTGNTSNTSNPLYLGVQSNFPLATYNQTNFRNTQSPVVNTTNLVDQPSKIKTLQEFIIEDPIIRGGANASQLYNDYVRQQTSMKYGGDLLIAENGIEKQQLSYDEWLKSTGRGMIGQELQDYQEYENYLSSLPSQTNEPSAPKVDITNKLAGNLNRFMDSRFMQGYGKIGNLAVQGAGFANEMYQNKKAREAEGRLYEMTQADNMFGYYEDPLNKQGTWDVNTGLAEQDNRVEYMRQFGGETVDDEFSNEIDLDPDTIAQLIAAGANIQIL
jgi:hypothetical protein